MAYLRKYQLQDIYTLRILAVACFGIMEDKFY